MMPNSIKPEDALAALRPMVTVVIPAYNAEKYLAQTLQSVRAQTFQAWQCIVVDDGSRDETARLVRELAASEARIRLVQQPNAGVSVARNTGFAHANPPTEFVAFLDADDLWEPEMLQTLVETLEAHPEAAAAHCNAFYIDSEGNRINEGVLEDSIRRRFCFDGRGIRRSTSNEPTTFAHTVVNVPIITPGCVLIRCAAIERVGSFNPDFNIAADWEMWVRLARLSDLLFVDRPLLSYRRHSSNMSSGRKKAIAEVRSLRRLMIESPANTPEQSHMALKAYRAFYWYQARLRYPSVWRHARNRHLKQAAQNLILALVNTAMAIKGRP